MKTLALICCIIPALVALAMMFLVSTVPAFFFWLFACQLFVILAAAIYLKDGKHYG